MIIARSGFHKHTQYEVINLRATANTQRQIANVINKHGGDVIFGWCFSLTSAEHCDHCCAALSRTKLTLKINEFNELAVNYWQFTVCRCQRWAYK